MFGDCQSVISILGFSNIIPSFLECESEEPADIGIVVDDEDRMGIRRISSIGHSYLYLPAPDIMVIGLFPLRGCGRFVNSSWIGLDDSSVGPAGVCSLGGGLLRGIWVEKHGDRSCRVKARHHDTSRARPRVSDYVRRIPFRRHRYESMPRDWPLVFGHPLI